MKIYKNNINERFEFEAQELILLCILQAISSKSSSSNLTVKNENGSTISIPVLHIPEEV